MSTPQGDVSLSGASGPGVVLVRLWAGAKAAAGVAEVTLDVPGPVSVSWVRDAVIDQAADRAPDQAPDRARLAWVLQVCSVLVGDQPLGGADPKEAVVGPGGTVEFLPPFAGG